MVSSNLGEVKPQGTDSEINADICCIIHSFISHFGIIQFHRILSIVSDKLGVDIFEK